MAEEPKTFDEMLAETHVEVYQPNLGLTWIPKAELPSARHTGCITAEEYRDRTAAGETIGTPPPAPPEEAAEIDLGGPMKAPQRPKPESKELGK